MKTIKIIFKSWWSAAGFVSFHLRHLTETTKIYGQSKTEIVVELDELTFDELFQVG